MHPVDQDRRGVGAKGRRCRPDQHRGHQRRYILLLEAGGGVGIEFRTGDAGEEELAEEFGIGHELLGKVKEGEISGGLAGRNGQLKRGA